MVLGKKEHATAKAGDIIQLFDAVITFMVPCSLVENSSKPRKTCYASLSSVAEPFIFLKTMSWFLRDCHGWDCRKPTEIEMPELAPYKPSQAAIAQFLKLHEPSGIFPTNTLFVADGSRQRRWT
jgi:hypothetical protein